MLIWLKLQIFTCVINLYVKKKILPCWLSFWNKSCHSAKLKNRDLQFQEIGNEWLSVNETDTNDTYMNEKRTYSWILKTVLFLSFHLRKTAAEHFKLERYAFLGFPSGKKREIIQKMPIHSGKFSYDALARTSK